MTTAPDFRGNPMPMRAYPTSRPIDAVVVGTGAGGAPLAATLAAAGRSVVCLEAGPFFAAQRDFVADERDQCRIYWNDERLSAGADPIPFGRNNSGVGVGGTTLHYTGFVPRARPEDFRIRAEFGVGRDWPIGYDDLAPYYAKVEQFLGVSGPSPYPWGPPRPAYPFPPLPLNGPALLMQRGCERLGIRTAPAANAALSRAHDQPGVGPRPACIGSGFCQAGCPIGAKGSMDVTYVPLAIRHGAEVRADCFVTRIERDGQGRVSGVVYVHQGTEHRQPCRALFLCAGAIETPRLLLMNGIANASGQVGRNFMAHTGLQVWGTFDEPTYPNRGIPAGLISEETHRPSDADFAGGYLLQSIGILPANYASQVATGRGLWGEPLRTHMRRFNHVAGIDILGECLPSDANRVELSDEFDARGLPKPRVSFTAGENERRMAAHAEKRMREIWTAAGGKDLWAFPRYAHTIGTCRMGTSAADSVVDADGRSFDTPNLFIADNSIFPSALPVNPSLTIMALSLRIADRFLAAPWPVRDGSRFGKLFPSRPTPGRSTLSHRPSTRSTAMANKTTPERGTKGNGHQLGKTARHDGSAPRGLSAQPITGQRGREIQKFGSLVNIPIGLDEGVRKQSVEMLTQVLVDTMSLRDLYKKHHWQVSGHTFYQLHLLFDKHYEEQSELVDTIAERIQLLGGLAIAMAADVAEMTKIERPPRGREEVPVQIDRLLQAHELILKQCRDYAEKAADLGDDGTNDLLVSDVIRTNELQTWFVAEHVVDGPLVRAE